MAGFKQRVNCIPRDALKGFGLGGKGEGDWPGPHGPSDPNNLQDYETRTLIQMRTARATITTSVNTSQTPPCSAYPQCTPGGGNKGNVDLPTWQEATHFTMRMTTTTWKPMKYSFAAW